jgi:hypothetical protein
MFLAACFETFPAAETIFGHRANLADSSTDIRRHPFQLTTGPMSFGPPLPSTDGGTLFAEGLLSRGELVRYAQFVSDAAPLVAKPYIPMLKKLFATAACLRFSGSKYLCRQEKFTSEDLRIIRGRTHKRMSAIPTGEPITSGLPVNAGLDESFNALGRGRHCLCHLCPQALRIFRAPAKTGGVHTSFPAFIRSPTLGQ